MGENESSTPESRGLHSVWLAEHAVVAESWRFLTGVRFSVLVFAATLLAILMGGYQYIVTNLDKLEGLGQIATTAVPIFGAMTTLAIILIEERTRNLYGSLLHRGLALEVFLDIPVGHFHALWSAPLPGRIVTHTRALRIIYGMIFLTWLALLVYGVAHFLKGGY